MPAISTSHRTRNTKAAGEEPGQRRMNGVQTSGRTYRELSPAEFNVHRTNAVTIPMRDGTLLRADVFLPTSGPARAEVSADGSVRTDPSVEVAPALVSFSCYARQIQDLGAPFGFLEAGTSDFFVPRGYAHVIVNARGTGGSEGTFGLLDQQEQEDIYDAFEWVAQQAWCSGATGGMGISYFAIAQLSAATQRPPHLKAIFPFATLDDLYDSVWHHGVLNSGFFSSWMSAIGIMAGISDKLWQSKGLDLIKKTLNTPAVHGQMDHVNGEVAAKAMREILRTHYAYEPFDRIWQEACVEHPTHDAWWDERNLRAALARIDIPVYLGCQWDNVPMHLPSSFPVWEHLRHNPNVRLTMIDKAGLVWPWETMHVEALAWYDHWIKGRDTGIMDGPPIRYVIPGTDEWRTADSWPPAETVHTEYALRADGTLAEDEGEPGQRTYLYLSPGSGRARNANPPQTPDRLIWETAAADVPRDVLGDLELRLDAAITATDTSWMVVLDDVAADQTSTNITAGWLRAELRKVEERTSRPGRPSLPMVAPEPIQPGATTSYRIPLVPNARRLAPGHRLRLTLTSSDEGKDGPTVLGFVHTSSGQSSINTVSSSSRLLVPFVTEAARS